MKLAVILGLWILASVPAGAQEPDNTAGGSLPRSAEITLRDGSHLVGHVIQETPDSLQVETPSLGRLTISRDQIASVDYTEPAPVLSPADSKHPNWRVDPDYNSVLLTPTPETLPKGSLYYRNFELLFNNFGYAPTDDVNLSLGFLFPVSSELQFFAAGVKWRLISRDDYPLGIALSAAGSGVYSDDDWEWLGTISVITGIGNRRWSLNGSFYHAFSDGDDDNFFLLAGDVQVGTGFKLLAEYGTSSGALLESEDYNGVIDLGFRVFWNEVSFTLTGIRPLESGGGSFIAFPLAVFSAHF